MIAATPSRPQCTFLHDARFNWKMARENHIELSYKTKVRKKDRREQLKVARVAGSPSPRDEAYAEFFAVQADARSLSQCARVWGLARAFIRKRPYRILEANTRAHGWRPYYGLANSITCCLLEVVNDPAVRFTRGQAVWSEDTTKIQKDAHASLIVEVEAWLKFPA